MEDTRREVSRRSEASRHLRSVPASRRPLVGCRARRQSRVFVENLSGSALTWLRQLCCVKAAPHSRRRSRRLALRSRGPPSRCRGRIGPETGLQGPGLLGPLLPADGLQAWIIGEGEAFLEGNRVAVGACPSLRAAQQVLRGARVCSAAHFRGNPSWCRAATRAARAGHASSKFWLSTSDAS